MSEDAAEWLLLAYQIPPRAASLRVRVWRRLQAIGAVAVGTSLYALPDRPACREDLEWLLRTIRAGDGDAAIVGGRLLGGLDDTGLRARFEDERNAEYHALARTLRAASGKRGTAADLRAALRTARRRLAEIEARDFHGADAYPAVSALLRRLESKAGGAAARKPREVDMRGKAGKIAALRGKTWVTRERVGVDRIACAWLVRRFIDPEACFRFVAGRNHRARPGEIRFDMYEGEFTHDGDRCTFEVLLDRCGLAQPGLRALAAIVHDIDLKDARFGSAETPGIAAVLDGLCRDGIDDETRLRRGGELFDDLYRRYAAARG